MSNDRLVYNLNGVDDSLDQEPKYPCTKYENQYSMFEKKILIGVIIFPAILQIVINNSGKQLDLAHLVDLCFTRYNNVLFNRTLGSLFFNSFKAPSP